MFGVVGGIVDIEAGGCLISLAWGGVGEPFV